jgi:hypothetical protein
MDLIKRFGPPVHSGTDLDVIYKTYFKIKATTAPG